MHPTDPEGDPSSFHPSVAEAADDASGSDALSTCLVMALVLPVAGTAALGVLALLLMVFD